MPLIIRPYADTDRAAMTALYTAAWHATYDAVDGAETIDRVIAALMTGESPEMFAMPSGDIALVALHRGRIVGGMRGHPRGDAVHLSGMYVAPEAQRLGIGGALLKELLRRLPDDTVLRADVRPTSTSARAFYARQGFVETGRGRTDVGGNHCVDMVELRRDAKRSRWRFPFLRRRPTKSA